MRINLKKKQRKAIYESALEKIDSKSNIHNEMCRIISWQVMTNIKKGDMIETEDFPELHLFKPYECAVFWFRSDDDNNWQNEIEDAMKIRALILEFCIAMTE